jgi:uncharacterized coiled-coil protein SlyX
VYINNENNKEEIFDGKDKEPVIIERIIEVERLIERPLIIYEDKIIEKIITKEIPVEKIIYKRVEIPVDTLILQDETKLINYKKLEKLNIFLEEENKRINKLLVNLEKDLEYSFLRIKDLEACIIPQNKTIEELNKTIENINYQILNLQEEMRSQSEKNNLLYRKLHKNRDEINELNKVILDKNNEIEKIKNEIINIENNNNNNNSPPNIIIKEVFIEKPVIKEVYYIILYYILYYYIKK